MYLDPYQSEKSFRIRIKVKSRIWIRIKMVWIRSNYPFKKQSISISWAVPLYRPISAKKFTICKDRRNNLINTLCEQSNIVTKQYQPMLAIHLPGNAATLAICLTPGRKPPTMPGLQALRSSSNISFSSWLFTQNTPCKQYLSKTIINDTAGGTVEVAGTLPYPCMRPRLPTICSSTIAGHQHPGN